MKKLFLSFAMLMVCSLIWADSVEIGGIYYNLIEKAKIAEVTKNPEKYYGTVNIPASITYNDETYNVTTIGIDAFNGCRKLLSVSIPNSVSRIEMNAFYYCNSLSSINIPNSVTYIGCNSFENCSGLTSLVIPNSVITIDNAAFAHCSSLNSIVIGDNVETIGKWAFQDCSSLTTFVFPDKVTIIEENVLANCENLKSVSFGNNVKTIDEGAFFGCLKLEKISIPSNVSKIGKDAFIYCNSLSSVHISDIEAWCKLTFTNEFSNPLSCAKHLYLNDSEIIELNIPNSITTINKYSFICCSGLNKIYIGNNVKSIGESAFKYCSNLKIITIGNNVQYIYSTSFANCKEMTDIYCYAKKVPYAGSDVFKDSYVNYVTLHVRESLIDAYSSVEPWNSFKSIAKIDIPKYTLKYVVDDEVYKSFQVEEGETITPEPAPTKEGYSFSGWSKIPETMPAIDVTVTGTFSINKYKLTYMVDGEEYKSYDIEYGATITPEVAPTKEGYTFSGWSEIPETMPAHDVVVYANYTSGIIETLMKTQPNIRIYSPNGKNLEKMQKGLNIVVLDDGTVKKVVVK